MLAKKVLITIAIAIIFAFFVGYGIEVFNPSVDYQDYCPNVYQYDNEADCVDNGGIWEDYSNNNVTPRVEGNRDGYCQNKLSCSNGYDDERANDDLVVFIVAVVIGLIAVIGGALLKQNTIGNGFVGGGLLSILYGTMRYWQHANDILKFVLLGAVLAILIFFTYKKLDKKN